MTNAVSNEELYEMYHNGDKLALDELYDQNTRYIKSLVIDMHARYLQFLNNSDSADELFQAASLEFINRIKLGKYDAEKGKLLTYLTQHMKNAMIDYIGGVSAGKSGKVFRQILKCQRLFKSGLSVEEITEHMKLKPDVVRSCIGYSFRRVSISPADDTESTDEICEDKIDSGIPSPDFIVYHDICADCARQLADKLSAKDREILYRYYGVFGYEKMTADEIGDFMMISRDAVMKSVVKSIEKLQEMYGKDSELLRWRCAKRMIRKVQRKI